MKLNTAKKRWNRWMQAHRKRFVGGYAERKVDRDQYCQWIWLDVPCDLKLLTFFINGNFGSLPPGYVVLEGIKKKYSGCYKKYLNHLEWIKNNYPNY